MKGLSGQLNTKDTDREILLRLSDKDLINTCRLNKYLFNNVCDDNFFRRKLQLSYPDTLLYFDVNKYKNYKNFYLNMVFYIAKLEEDFKYSYVSKNPKTQYEIFKRISKEVIKHGKKEFLISYLRLLLAAAQKGELDLVKEAVKNGVNIHALNEEALRKASENGQLEVLKYLVENGVDIHVADEYALKYASEGGHYEVVKYLVEKGANIHVDNELALIYASRNGHLETVKYLVENGANIHVNNDEALRWASKNGHLEVVKYLQSL